MESYQHNQVKLAVAHAVHAWTRQRGLFFTDGMMLELPKADRVIMPDGFFIRFRNLTGGCRFRRNASDAVRGVIGVPNIIVEVASPSRLEADYHDKLELYQKNGVHSPSTGR